MLALLWFGQLQLLRDCDHHKTSVQGEVSLSSCGLLRRSPGPIQFEGPAANSANFTLSLELCNGQPIEIA